MKRALKIGLSVLAVFTIGAIVAYIILAPGNNIAALNNMATSPIWPKRAAPGRMLLKNVTIVDTQNGALSKDMNILVERGKIAAIFKGDSGVAGEGLQIVDEAGAYVVPGYMNMHMHIIDQGDPSAELALMLVSGTTSFRQMSGSVDLLKLRKEKGLPLQEQQPALLAMPGSVLTPINTHDRQQAIENVREQKAAGADFIKIGLLPPSLFFAVIAEANRLGIPALGHVPGNVDIIAASDSGFRSIEHLGLDYAALTACSSDEKALRDAAPTLPGIIYHLPGFTDRLFMHLLESTLVNPAVGTKKEEYARISRLIATFSESKARRLAAVYDANRTWQCPTLSKLRSYQLAFLPEVQNNFGTMPKDLEKIAKEVTEKYERQLTPETKQEVIKAYELELKLVRIYDSAGVKILAGTDNVGGYTLWQEFDELAKAGLTPLHVLQTATLNPAQFLDRTADLGAVRPGHIADLILLDGNPVESVQNLHRIHAVIRAGYYFNEQDLTNLKRVALLQLAK